MISAIALVLVACNTTGNRAAAEFAAEKQRMTSDHRAELAKCEAYAGETRSMCIVEAKAAKVKAMADAQAKLAGTEDAAKIAAEEKIDADYQIAKEQCSRFAAPARDNCLASAKKERNAALDAVRAEHEERLAELESARRKCHDLAGSYRSLCLAEAEAQLR